MTLAVTKDSEATGRIMKRLKELEHMGYQFEGAEGSFELLVIKELGLFKPSFELIEYRVMIDEPSRTERSSTVTMKIKVMEC